MKGGKQVLPIDKIVVLDPTAKRESDSNQTMAKRCPSLNDKRIGFLSNGKPNATLLMQRLEYLLSQKYDFKEIIHQEKPKASIAASFLDEWAYECNVVVNGVGD